MDLTFTEDQDAIAELAGRILSEKLPPERLRDLEASGALPDDVWNELAKADLLGVCLPEADGGGGYGVIELGLVAEQVGRAAAPLPFTATIAAAMTIAAHGSEAQRAALLPGVIAGTTILTSALAEAGNHAAPVVPATQAVAIDGGWELTGDKSLVPYARFASHVLVPARTGDSDVALFLVDAGAPGLSVTDELTIDRQPEATLRLDRVRVNADDVIGAADAGRAVVSELVDRTICALCFTALGVCESALALTAAYVSEREQFGVKIGTFQAVAHRAADAYIDTEAIRLTAWQAGWRLAAGLPAEEALAVAKFWAAEGSQRVVHAAQHLHGGIGVDTDYPVHRFFRWAKVVELTLGGATQSLLRLGEVLARNPAAT